MVATRDTSDENFWNPYNQGSLYHNRKKIVLTDKENVNKNANANLSSADGSQAAWINTTGLQKYNEDITGMTSKDIDINKMMKAAKEGNKNYQNDIGLKHGEHYIARQTYTVWQVELQLPTPTDDITWYRDRVWQNDPRIPRPPMIPHVPLINNIEDKLYYNFTKKNWFMDAAKFSAREKRLHTDRYKKVEILPDDPNVDPTGRKGKIHKTVNTLQDRVKRLTKFVDRDDLHNGLDNHWRDRRRLWLGHGRIDGKGQQHPR